MNDNLENHLVLNTADAPWNQPDAPQWECACGADYAYDVKVLTYAKWRDNGRKFLEDCAHPDCTKRVCHGCSVTCRICGCHWCPEHRAGFNKDLNLCEECGAYYATFATYIEASEVEKLVEIERRLMSGRCYGRGAPLDSEVDWLILSLKEAWESMGKLHPEAKRGPTVREFLGRGGGEAKR